jgi:REP element-mobilizing transposase RayT
MSQPQALLRDQFYHIYNHAVEGLNLFRCEDDYHRFLRLYAKHIEPIAETFAFCLLPNHLHSLIHTKAPHEQALSGNATQPREPSQHFANLFNAYARYYNSKYRRRGPLFLRPFKRKEVNSTRYFKTILIYIHQNARHHELVEDFRDWPYTSYHLFLSKKPSRLKRDAAISWFSDANAFVAEHERIIDFRDITPFILDD